MAALLAIDKLRVRGRFHVTDEPPERAEAPDQVLRAYEDFRARCA